MNSVAYKSSNNLANSFYLLVLEYICYKQFFKLMNKERSKLVSSRNSVFTVYKVGLYSSATKQRQPLTQ